MRRLRIAQVAPPLERVPPRMYGGTERVIFELVNELQRRGHEVVLFASGDSDVPCELVPTVPQALRPTGFGADAAPYFLQTMQQVLEQADDFDLIHSHLEWHSLLLARATRTPVVSTFHGRLDFPFARRLFEDQPPGLVAISQSQCRVHPTVPFSVVHNGLSLAGAPFERRRTDDLCFVGRVAQEKGILDAIEVARLTGRKLRIAAKIGPIPAEYAFYKDVFLPALDRADVEFLGEVPPDERDRLMASSYAFLMPGLWPEPFGLVAIEALACGTPIIARRAGALPEIIRHGVDGFFADDVDHMAFVLDQVVDLDRLAIRESVLERFSAVRMTDGYESVYERVLEERASADAAVAIPSVGRGRDALASRTADGHIPVGPGRLDGGQPNRQTRLGTTVTPLTAARSSGALRVASPPLVRPLGPRLPRPAPPASIATDATYLPSVGDDARVDRTAQALDRVFERLDPGRPAAADQGPDIVAAGADEASEEG